MKEYFSHDHNARNDRKIIALVNKHKAAGYGIFWATNEMMHEEGGELELDEITYIAIAKHLNEDITHIQLVIKDCIEIFLLYHKIGNKLTSNRVLKNLNWQGEKKLEKSEAGRLGGIKSGESRRKKQNEAPLEANEAPLEATKQMKLNEMKLNEMKYTENDFVCNDAEQYILKNQQLFEKICIATSKGSEVVKRELRLFHLWMEKNNKYPSNNRAVSAGLESWLLNDFKNKYKPQENSIGSTEIPHNLKKLNPQ